MKIGVWFYGLGTVLTGILDIAWGEFDALINPSKPWSQVLLVNTYWLTSRACG
jgi:hypothetical protein